MGSAHLIYDRATSTIASGDAADHPSALVDGPEAVLQRVRDIGPFLKRHADEVERSQRIPSEVAEALGRTGVLRLLQPAGYGGYECDPRLFFQAVMEVARCCASSGWVMGTMGLHAWEFAVCDPKVPAEIWGDGPDVWAASSYMPTGRVVRVDGGYEVSGRWGFSSGVDIAHWVILAGLEVDDSGEVDPAHLMHVFLQEGQYEIVDGSWDVIGLAGTGSKDVVVSYAFVPEHRTLTQSELSQGRARGLRGDSPPLYRMPWSAVYPAASSASVLGAAMGALDAAVDYQRSRVSPLTGAIVDAPVTKTAISRAAGEIDASVASMMANLGAMWELVLAGAPVPTVLRSRTRRDQVQGCWRAVRAVDDLFDNAGGGALRRGTPLQRFWRDAHGGLHHAFNVVERVFQSDAGVAMGLEPTDPLL